MTDLKAAITGLERPRLLIRAARAGLADYDRRRDLGRLIGMTTPQGPDRTLPRLIEAEDQQEERRREGSLTYSFSRHIDLLIALMAEARLLPATA